MDSELKNRLVDKALDEAEIPVDFVSGAEWMYMDQVLPLLKQNEELKSLLINYQLGFATQTEIREQLEQKLEVAKRALEDIEQIDIDTHKRHPEYEGQWSEYVDVARKALRDMNG